MHCHPTAKVFLQNLESALFTDTFLPSCLALFWVNRAHSLQTLKNGLSSRYVLFLILTYIDTSYLLACQHKLTNLYRFYNKFTIQWILASLWLRYEELSHGYTYFHWCWDDSTSFEQTSSHIWELFFLDKTSLKID